MLCKVVLPFESLDKIVCYDLLMKAFEQYFAVVLFIVLKVSSNNWVSGQNPEMFGHSNESSSGVRLHGTILCPFLY